MPEKIREMTDEEIDRKRFAKRTRGALPAQVSVGAYRGAGESQLCFERCGAMLARLFKTDTERTASYRHTGRVEWLR